VYAISDSQESVTTDDLIPFLVYIIVLSKPKYLRTNLFLMENMTFIGLSTNEMGYTHMRHAPVHYVFDRAAQLTVSFLPAGSTWCRCRPLYNI
jgi:hypothetical protein